MRFCNLLNQVSPDGLLFAVINNVRRNIAIIHNYVIYEQP